MTAVFVAPIRSPNKLPPLENGDHLDQPTFHLRYLAMPENYRAELIGGIVYVPSPLKADHGKVHANVVTWAGIYRSRTPGSHVLDNATDILGPDSEPQPDTLLYLEGGQTRLTKDGYLEGPPELIAEVASSSASYDLHAKLRDYEKHGVGEYVVLLVRESRAVWFVRPGGPASGFVEAPPDADGIYRSKLLPGLWLDPAALFRDDLARVLEVLHGGLASPEHAAFAARPRP
jgi:Uma2 family endonuclease